MMLPAWMILLAACGVSPATPLELRHEFLAIDESRHQLVHVDQRDATRNWTIPLPGKHRDIQLIGQQRVLVSGPEGFREYNLVDRQMVREVGGFPGTVAARRQPDGRTIVACNQRGAVVVYDLGPDDRRLREVTFKLPTTRLVRLTPGGTLLLGSKETMFEGRFDGSEVRRYELPAGSWIYQALQRPDGHLLLAGGYPAVFYELDPQGKIVKSIGGKETPEGKQLGFHFFGGFQVLRDGNLVICNWTGHGARDSDKGVQLVEYTPAGELVWKWHDAQLAGSLDGIIVLDGLDPAVLHDDVSGVLQPNGGKM